MSPYGTFDATVNNVVAQLSKGPWLLGEKFTCVDVLWGTALTWMTGFGMIEAVPPIKAYVERWNARPSVKAVAEIDAGLKLSQQA
jgi:glutathione S-transferase